MTNVPDLWSTVDAFALAEIAARHGAAVIGAVIRDDLTWHRQHPYVAYRWHETLAKLLPRWRWLARAWHEMRARRCYALAMATRDKSLCEKAEDTWNPSKPDTSPFLKEPEWQEAAALARGKRRPSVSV